MPSDDIARLSRVETEINMVWADMHPDIFLKTIASFDETYPAPEWSRRIDLTRNGFITLVAIKPTDEPASDDIVGTDPTDEAFLDRARDYLNGVDIPSDTPHRSILVGHRLRTTKAILEAWGVSKISHIQEIAEIEALNAIFSVKFTKD